MKVNDEYTVKIEKITNLGLGLARIEGFVVFVENTCPEDIVKIKYKATCYSNCKRTKPKAKGIFVC